MARFSPGRSGNPGGRPRGLGQARQLAREQSGAAVYGLVRICCDAQASPHAVQRAAVTLLRLGWGGDVLTVRAAGQARGLTGGARGQWPGLRPLVEALLAGQDREYAAIRRRILLEVDQLERDEGLTVLPPGWTDLG